MNSQTDTPAKPSPSTTTKSGENEGALNRIVKRLGGRHLIFRTQLKGWTLVPHSYALISDFRGAVWFFYGVGQVWVTHKVHREFDGWAARVPRLGGQKVTALVDRLADDIARFTHFCNQRGIEGTIVLETSVIEFHWTFGYSLKREKEKPEQADSLDHQFQKLVDAFLTAKAELRL